MPYITGGNSDQKLNVYLPQRENRHLISLFVLGGPNIPLIRHFAKLGYIGIEVYHSEGTTLRAIQNAFCALAWVHANAETYAYDPRYTVVVGTSVLGGQAGELGVIDDPTTYMEDCPHALPEGDRLAGVITLAGALDVVSREEIDGSEPPFLLIHGTDDTMIEPLQSEAFAGVLESAGVEVQLVLLPDVGHDSILSNQEALKEIEEFLVHLSE
jgi:acetyl esterase/lipase